MNQEERTKVIKKGRRWLMEYLGRKYEEKPSMDNETRRKLFRIIGDEYMRLAEEDMGFCEKIDAFCSKRRFWNEKEVFFKGIMKDMVRSGSIHREYAAKHPGEYTVPERFAR